VNKKFVRSKFAVFFGGIFSYAVFRCFSSRFGADGGFVIVSAIVYTDSCRNRETPSGLGVVGVFRWYFVVFGPLRDVRLLDLVYLFQMKTLRTTQKVPDRILIHS
jgi:hypothetical protein